VTLTSFTVSGAPEIRSAPTTLVPPTFPHSLRIVRTGTDVASTVTRPFWKLSFNGCWAKAGEAIMIASTTVRSVGRIGFRRFSINLASLLPCCETQGRVC
jgi:hypothetical protein